MQRFMVFGLLIALLTAARAQADGETDRGREPAAKPTPNQASDASFDKRLPPVLPGEEVSDSGRTMKVWSTAGPVTVSSPPEPPRPCSAGDPNCRRQGEVRPGDISVIIDGRPRVRGPEHRGSEY